MRAITVYTVSCWVTWIDKNSCHIFCSCLTTNASFSAVQSRIHDLKRKDKYCIFLTISHTCKAVPYRIKRQDQSSLCNVCQDHTSFSLSLSGSVSFSIVDWCFLPLKEGVSHAFIDSDLSFPGVWAQRFPTERELKISQAKQMHQWWTVVYLVSSTNIPMSHLWVIITGAVIWWRNGGLLRRYIINNLK